ncbi:hypothetical protein Rs2_21593 [Raphanus sativus]|nr:hypothetical protein Rs2_21593 [Raphanus sativus]
MPNFQGESLICDMLLAFSVISNPAVQATEGQRISGTISCIVSKEPITDMSQPLTPKRRKKENPVTVATISLNEGHPKTVTTLCLSLIRSNIVTRLLGAAEAEEEEGLVKKGVRMVFIRYKFAD